MDYRGVEELVMDYLVERDRLDIYDLLLEKFIKFLESIAEESRLFFIDNSISS